MPVDQFDLIIGFHVTGQGGKAQWGKEGILDGTPERLAGLAQGWQDKFRFHHRLLGCEGSVYDCKVAKAG
jgi:hypothetical protein